MGDRRKSVNIEDGGDGSDFAWDWDNASTPLQPCGKKLKFIKPMDKHSANEGETVFIDFVVEGDPAPETVLFHKGFKDLSMEPRYQIYTHCDNGVNRVILGVKECRQEEEGGYKVTVKNSAGAEEEFDFKFFVTVEGGMDFRAMLMRRKKPQKKVVVKKVEWLEKPTDESVQEGKCDKVTFYARFSEPEKKGKWYIRNNASYKDMRSTEYGLELHKEQKEKYEWTNKGDCYTLTVFNPTVADAGRYNLVVKIEKETYICGGLLEVSDADPEFYFTQTFKEKKLAHINRQTKLVCQLNQSGAKVRWLKSGKPISFSDSRYQRKDEGEKFTLIIRKVKPEDLGMYSFEIQGFVKEGEKDQIDCWLDVQEYPHKFTKKLENKSCVEHQEVSFEVEVEENDADVTWFIDGKKINPDDKRFQVVVQGTKRKLVIKETALSDTGEIRAETNSDQTSCQLRVAHANAFVTALPTSVNVVERESASFVVQVKDPDAPVDFYVAGKKIDPSDPRFDIRQIEPGKHQLIINKVKMEDGQGGGFSDVGMVEARSPSNYGDGDEISTVCNFHVEKGEEAPKMKLVPPVTGVAAKECNWKVPFEVPGVQQSPVEVIVMKDGKELRIGQDVALNMHTGKIDLSVINPKREKSGTYTVIMRNAQGEDSQDIEVNIMDKPTPPQSCTVTDVFYDNCVVHWTPPVI